MKCAGKVFLGVLIVGVVLVGGAWVYLRYGHVPVAVADAAFPMEKQIVSVPLHARMKRELKTAPMEANEAVFLLGAKTYGEECAVCHGTPEGESIYAKSMYPAPPQLWKKHKTGNVVGVSDDEPGETYWVITWSAADGDAVVCG